jgi:hypothetical protein
LPGKKLFYKPGSIKLPSRCNIALNLYSRNTFMKRLITLLLIFFSGFANAQERTVVSKAVAIAAVRSELKTAFLSEDPAAASLWMDSLARLEDPFFVALAWDERWLLYYWTESYGNLFTEAMGLDADARAQLSWKIQPPRDSLFEWIDYSLNERRFELFDRINRAFLTEDEKVFAVLQLEYLLRLETDEKQKAAKIEAFKKRFPNSRFNRYLQSVKPMIATPVDKAFTLDILFTNGNWNDRLERYFKPGFGIDLGLGYWSKRWNVLFRGIFTGQSLDRDVIDDSYIWPKGEPSSFKSFNMELGYDAVHTTKMRLFPTVGGGFAGLTPPSPGEDEDPLPDYYDLFRYNTFYLSGALNADVKFNRRNASAETKKDDYHGVRVRFGYRRLNFDRKNSLLKGNMFFFSVGYNLFVRVSEYR